MAKATLRTCPAGHQYYKSSDCPVCPVCEAKQKPAEGFLSKLGAPARRALEREGITTLEKVAGYTPKELLSLHGIGPSSLPVLRTALKERQLDFKGNEYLINAKSAKFSTADEYIGTFPGVQKRRLLELRRIIKQAAPAKATEVISYNMPAIKLNRVLVYYAAYATHIGFYPTGEPIRVFAAVLKDYKTSKGAIQFPLHESLPAALIKEIVAYRAKEDERAAGIKKSANPKNNPIKK